MVGLCLFGCESKTPVPPKAISDVVVAETASPGPAYTYQELQQVLPTDTIAGFRVKGLPSGANFRETPSESYSTCEQQYAHRGATLTITLTDCRNAPIRLTAAKSRMVKHMTREDTQQRVVTTDFGIPGLHALTFYEKPSQTSRLTAVLNSRYIVMVSAFPQPSTDLVEDVFFSLDLERLTAR